MSRLHLKAGSFTCDYFCQMRNGLWRSTGLKSRRLEEATRKDSVGISKMRRTRSDVGPVAKPATEGKLELRRWAVGRHQESTGSYVRTFVNSKQKKLVTLRSADGKEFNIFHRSLTQEDVAYLKSIQAETKQ